MHDTNMPYVASMGCIARKYTFDLPDQQRADLPTLSQLEARTVKPIHIPASWAKHFLV
jgi:hypothetical protein